MKIIDLLNKIANGEKLPEKIYCFDEEYYLKGNTYFGDTFTLMHYIQEENLNDEVEIIEEEKKIPEKLGEIAKTDEEYAYCWTGTEAKLKDKINEIIDYLKSKGE